MTAYGTGDKGRATKLHAELVRARGACERCGSTHQLQAAHIVSRRYSHTRCVLDNAWCLCARCHWALTADPLGHVEFAYATIGEARYRELRRQALERTKVDWAAVLADLRAR